MFGMFGCLGLGGAFRLQHHIATRAPMCEAEHVSTQAEAGGVDWFFSYLGSSVLNT
jgi:hypothetical protein